MSKSPKEPQRFTPENGTRRPGAVALANALRKQNPTWSDQRCLEEAKARWTLKEKLDDAYRRGFIDGQTDMRDRA